MIERAFAKAYNARNPVALTGLLAPDATTELVGSDFPREQGAGAIREGSFAHLLEGEDLAADVITHGGARYVAFRDEDGELDSLAAIQADDGVITNIRYHTRWHDEEFVASVATDLDTAS